MIFNHVAVNMSILWLPLIILEIYAFALGLALFLSASFVRYRDISYIWEVILQALFYLTPILYPISKLKWPIIKELLFVSPLTQGIQAARYSIVTNKTYTINQVTNNALIRIAPYLILILTLIIGVAYFRSKSKTFAEDI